MSFRLDRLATLYVMGPFRRLALRRPPSIPILMYHSISEDAENGVHPYYRTATSPERFAAQMRFLHDHGYRTASLAEVVERCKGLANGTDKRVAVTFDDGYRDFYRHAFPVLSQHGFTATVFLPTASIGDSPVSFKGKQCLTWSEVRELNRHGILFGSHTVTHPQLRELNASAIHEEITESKKTIEEKLGCAADSFAYPYAFPQIDTDFKQMLRDTLRTAGYKTGVCTTVGRANRSSQTLFMERLPVNSCDDVRLFKAKLEGAYDWIAKTQYLVKLGKGYLRGTTRGAKYRIANDFPAVQ